MMQTEEEEQGEEGEEDKEEDGIEDEEKKEEIIMNMLQKNTKNKNMSRDRIAVWSQLQDELKTHEQKYKYN